MRIGNLHGRLIVEVSGRAVDVHEASAGAFAADPAAIFARWDEFIGWARDAQLPAGHEYDSADLGAPSPRPGQVFALGVNYREHGAEAGYPPDELPMLFTKFPSCISGPRTVVALSGDRVDWEVELVVVIGLGGRRVSREDAWRHVAGLTVGQDISDRAVQLLGTKPQFSMGKSFEGYGPTGPLLVTTDELAHPEDLDIGCAVLGDVVQHSQTSRMIYDIPEIITRLSAVVELRPGDLIFTGTPQGVGNQQSPPRYLGPGDVLTSTIEDIGSLVTTFVATKVELEPAVGPGKPAGGHPRAGSPVDRDLIQPTKGTGATNDQRTTHPAS